MKPVDQMSESDARQRLDIIAGYLETLLRNAWDDLDTVGLLHEGMARGKRVAADEPWYRSVWRRNWCGSCRALGHAHGQRPRLLKL